MRDPAAGSRRSIPAAAGGSRSGSRCRGNKHECASTRRQRQRRWRTARFTRERLSAATRGDYSTATDLVDYLARRSVPFGDAHDVSRRIVMDCLGQGRALEDLSLAELQSYSPLFGEDALAEVSPERSAARRTSEGGTAPECVREQIALARDLMREA